MKLKRGAKLGQILVAEGLLSEADLNRALRHQAADNRRLGEVLINLNMLSAGAMLSALAKHLGVKSVQLRHGLIDPAAARLIDRDEAARLAALPLFKVGKRLTVAMAEPQSLPAIDRLAHLTGCEINPVLALERNIAEYQSKYLGDHVDVDSFLVNLKDSDVEVVERESVDDDTAHEISRMVEGSPIINLVNLAVMTAIRDGASDIHVEPTKRSTQIRYRIDGHLRELMAAPPGMHGAIVSRIKVIGKMDIAERRLPQEGRIHVVAEGREIDLRVSTMPTLLGEKAVLRILDKKNLTLSLEKLGVDPGQLDRFRRIFSKPHGLVLVTGPTGSGKTTTLYSVLDLLNSTDRNIVTIEDPVEYQLDSINQIQVCEPIGLTFARALRSILRQDPDVIMVGEIRDQDTARVAVQAALTGHLVLSTLHTNDAPSAITRLVDIGVQPFLIGATLLGVVAQRLVRTLCPHCKQPAPLDVKAWQGLVGANAIPHPKIGYRAVGCEECRQTGYLGRTGLYEMLTMRKELNTLLQEENVNAGRLREAALQLGMRSLRVSGADKVSSGLTTIAEVLSVLPAG